MARSIDPAFRGDTIAAISACEFAALVRRPIAACIVSAFAFALPAGALAGTVTSCLDDGSPGTLRSVITAAAEGATVDFASGAFTCGTVTLLTGEITIAQNSLTIDGAALINGEASHMTVDAFDLPRAFGYCRVFHHSGTGTLTLKNLTATRGAAIYYPLGIQTKPYGGCIVSKGSVTLEQVEVSNCMAESAHGGKYAGVAVGGAIAALNDVKLTNSSVTNNIADGNYGARGGGIYGNNVSLTNSTVSHNTATSSGGKGYGGGAFAKINMTIAGGDVSYNAVNALYEAAGGGVYVAGSLTGATGFSVMRNNSVTSTQRTARGGGAFMHGNLSPSVDTFVKYNSVASQGGDASGGGLYVGGNLSFSLGAIYANTAGTTSGFVRGGGARVLGGATFNYTSIFDNAANNFGFGGGLYVVGTANIRHSTISGNSAGVGFGGVFAFAAAPAALSFTMENSTLSGNTGANKVGGLYTNFGHVNFQDSTIAFNSAGANPGGLAPGVGIKGPSTVLMQNTLMSNNSVGTVDDDLSTTPDVTFSAASSTNLVRATTVSNLPAGSTTFGVCPLLGPLRLNGGVAWTHALESTSPAVDHGGPTTYPNQTGYDQRGTSANNKSTGDYLRISGPIGGPTPVADIGAYEVQQNDVVFDTSFEGCNALP